MKGFRFIDITNDLHAPYAVIQTLLVLPTSVSATIATATATTVALLPFRRNCDDGKIIVHPRPDPGQARSIVALMSVAFGEKAVEGLLKSDFARISEPLSCKQKTGQDSQQKSSE